MEPSQAIILAEYNTWANHLVILKLARLSAGQLGAEASLSYHSLLATAVHLVDVEWYWREGIQTGCLPLEKLTLANFATFATLRQRWQLEDRLLVEFIRGLSLQDLNNVVTYTWARARPRRRPLWQVLFHILNHATHHRSELGQALAVLDASPGDMDFMKFLSHLKSASS